MKHRINYYENGNKWNEYFYDEKENCHKQCSLVNYGIVTTNLAAYR